MHKDGLSRSDLGGVAKSSEDFDGQVASLKKLIGRVGGNDDLSLWTSWLGTERGSDSHIFQIHNHSRRKSSCRIKADNIVSGSVDYLDGAVVFSVNCRQRCARSYWINR